MINFLELFEHIRSAYGIELNDLQKGLIERILLGRLEFLRLPESHRTFLSELPALDFTTEKALLVGERRGISRATIFRILGNERLFIKLGHGLYQRLF